MRIFDKKVVEAVDSGLVTQVLLADEQGYLMDSVGDKFDPDTLLWSFLCAEQAIVGMAGRLEYSPLSEFSVRLEGTDVTLACRRVFSDFGGFVVIVAVPSGYSHRLVTSHVVHSCKRYMSLGVKS